MSSLPLPRQFPLNLSETDTIIATISALAATVGLLYSPISYRGAARFQYYQMMKDVDDERTTLEDSEERKNVRTYYIYAYKYLNLAERLAYLSIKKE
jgi:hypothetical protein